MAEGEIWIDIIGCEGLYQVSNCGRVRSLDIIQTMGSRWGKPRSYTRKGRIKKLKNHRNGYLQVVLFRQRMELVHRLVAIHFIGTPPQGCEVNHIDGNKQNNHVDNLQWVTKSENQKHRYDILGKAQASQFSGFQKHNEMLRSKTELYRDAILSSGESAARLSKKMPLSKSTIQRILNSHG